MLVDLEVDVGESFQRRKHARTSRFAPAGLAIDERDTPQQLCGGEARAAGGAIAGRRGLTEKKQMGKRRKAVMAGPRGTIDGKLASRIAVSILG